ncbi:hypothetical protein YN1HA_5980 [Sulfurisphaera ohwakuensis]
MNKNPIYVKIMREKLNRLYASGERRSASITLYHDILKFSHGITSYSPPN